MTEYGRGPGSQPWHPEDPLYGDQGYTGQQYAAQQQQVQQPPYGQQHYPGQQQYGWDPSQDTGGPYAAQPGAVPYTEQHTGQYPVGHTVEQADHYGHTDPYPPQHQEQVPQQQTAYVGEQRTAEAEPADDRISLFDDPAEDPAVPAGTDEEAGEAEPAGERKRGRGRTKKPKKRRSGTACLLVAVVLVGGVGGLGYLGYDYWQANFGPAPDFDGEGTGQVQVVIPKGSSLTQMGQILEKNGVVKSARAFAEAADKSAKGKGIQPGTYSLRKEMSAQAAIAMMSDNTNFLTFGEGTRAVDVYAAIDKKLDLKPGTTKDVAKDQAKNLGLPDWANDDPKIKDPLEGFLFPSQYNAGKGTKPEDILRQMVARAKDNYAQQDLDGKAKELGLKSPMQLVTVASLVQAEGVTHDDFRKMARVVYNRLKPTNTETNGKLQFDSTFNYLKNQSKINIGTAEIHSDQDPYNTYVHKGLPPGPIGNPGMVALQAAMDPEQGDWYYFVSIDGKTQFATTLAEHDKLVREFNDSQKKKKQG
ncbi:endolytic transglycosylase MltG [Streptomyces morookaense]|uniref:Endolytic murein transglycosylase n=1 Tax=Streptomyces morookaense TaxID=1970 RepID=A0A7Y7E9S4_STRMO|nr:endolytic transglycosylase MltG [Streptomyces morookaense]NVK80732.1 endolytic transglycosylase MltG [Streptomyces morookaense]GHF51721.1 membrane protein [Streptomyces morookaense]